MSIFASVYTRTDLFQIAFTLERISSQVQPRFQHYDLNLITKQSEIGLDFDPYPDPNEYTLKSDPKWVQISRPKWVHIHRSSVSARPICASFGADPLGFVLV